MIKVCLYSLASIFSLAVLLAAEHAIGGDTRFMGESLGLVVVLLSCQICFHLNGVDDLLVDSKTQIFLQKILRSVGSGLIMAAILFYVFPKLSPGYAAAAASACFLMFGLVVLRPLVRSIARRPVPRVLHKPEEKILVDQISSEREIFDASASGSDFYQISKRCLDIVLSVYTLLIIGPLMALIALIVRLESPGPAIFRQERVGCCGKRFIVYKFRSMREDAEKHTGPMWAQVNDNRITAVGAILRKCRLDELPQVFNVLKGDMSVIGPRPERPYFVELLNSKVPYYDLRHKVKPGITGWAQVMYRYGASVEDAYEKLQYDLYYAKNASLLFDLRILLKTFKVVIAGEGR
jgi:lipopolysaccharide/colanic/teichoic acid biosynthesis glycosyltransferase